MRTRKRPALILTVLAALVASLCVVVLPSQEAKAAPCPWGTQCNEVTPVLPTPNSTLSGTAQLEARVRQTTPARGPMFKVEWWLYHPSFIEQTPENHEGKILIYEALAPSTGDRMDGVWKGTWTVPANHRMTTRDGAYDLPGTRTYDLPSDGRPYSVEIHVLDDEWTRTWGGPSGRSGAIPVNVQFEGIAPPPPPVDGQATVGNGSFPLAGTDIFRAANTLVRYNPAAGQTVSPANQWGTEIAVRNGSVTAVRDRTVTNTAMAIPDDGFVLSGHGSAAAFLNSFAFVGAPVSVPAAPPPAPPGNPGPGQVGANGSVFNLAGDNIFRSADTLVRYTRTGTQTVSPANQWGTEATVLNGVVTEMHRGAPASPIPVNGYVLSGHGTASDWLFTNAKVNNAIAIGTGTTPPPPTGTCTDAATPWSASYYSGIALAGTPVLQRCEAAINYSWPGTQGPVASLGGSTFSARWTASPTFTAGDWTFTATADDGVRLKIDGTTVIDQWRDQGATAFAVTRTLTAGAHRIDYEYYENFGDATAKLTYAAAGTPPPGTIGGDGRWTVLPMQSPVRAIHATLLNDGRVLLIAGSGNDPNAFAAGSFKSSVWNPTTNTFLDVPTPADMFCSGHVTLADGKVLVAGGTISYPGVNGQASYKGAKFSYLFDPVTNQYTRTNDMQEGHWYPTLTKTENGDVWAAGGYSERGDGYSINTELFRAAQGKWLTNAEVPQSNQNWGTYPHMFLLADGRMFYTGAHTFGAAKWNAPGGAQIYDWKNATTGDVYGLRDKELRDQAGSVILPPAQNQRFMITAGGSTDSGGFTAKTDVIDLKQATPTYQPAQDLPGPARMYVNLTTLPDRTVLATGGGNQVRGGSVNEAAVFNPTSNTWRSVAADPVGRNYHSSSLLLPDGRVAVFGSNPLDGSYEARISVYEPPYLTGGAARPTITSVSAGANSTYGGTFNIGVTGNVVAANLTSPGSATHQTDANARLIDLPITGTGTTRSATVPTNPALLPPGPYMLTVLDSNGVPSAARWINIR